MRIMLTGGNGFIGSHVAVALQAAGHDLVTFDNLANSRRDVVERIRRITGRPVPLVVGDIRDRSALIKAMSRHRTEAVIHLAGHKAVGESVADPLAYYENNVAGSLNLASALAQCGVKTLVFSSSATVYGNPRYLPIDEAHPVSPTNP